MVRLTASSTTSQDRTLSARMTTSQTVKAVVLLLDLVITFLRREFQETCAFGNPVRFSATDTNRGLPWFLFRCPSSSCMA